MLTLNETEHQQNTSKKMGNSREEKKNKSHKRSKHTNSGRKLRSSVDFVPHKIETQEEDESMELSYLGKDPSVSSQIKMEASENENEYIILSHLESMKEGDDDESNESVSYDEDQRIPNIENMIYESTLAKEQNTTSDKKDIVKWSKKLHPLSLYYTDRSKPYLKCPACGAMFFDSNTYQRHLHSHMHKITENYVCDFCDYSNAEPGMLFAHLTKHQNQCEACNESLLRKDNFEKHWYKCSLAFTLTRDQHGRFVCTICELVFDLLAQLEKHWFKHTCKKQKSYQCNECSGLYENLETLKNHKCLKCPVCGEVYESLHRLKIHTMWMKHYLKCPICSYEFILSMDHEKHLALHRKVYEPMKDYVHCLRAADGKTFQCNLCDKIFYALPTLLTHLTEEHDIESAKAGETNMEDTYELKGDIIDIVVVPDFKESASYSDNSNDTSSLQQDTNLDDTL